MARGKTISHFCNHCGRVTKMGIIGANEEQPDRTWYRCQRCRHASLINLEEIRKVQDESRKKLDKTQCTEYKPENTYSIGQAIVHTAWDDIGKIVSKVTTSDGAHAIVVSFERLGERRLLESVTFGNE